MSSRKKRYYDPSEEAKKDYIGYNGNEMYAKTDIPLHPVSGINYLTQSQVWADYDPCAELLDVVKESDERYVFTAKHYGEAPLRIETDVYTPSYPSKRAVLIVCEYGRLCQQQIIDELVADGFTVFVPDYCAARQDTLTAFPGPVAYGAVGEGGVRMTQVFPTAKETCNYLYCMILRRCVTLIEKHFSLRSPILIALRDGVEYAMQTAGSDTRIRGLACLGGAGYKEFLSQPFYKQEEVFYSPDEVAWLTGVSGVSYLIERSLPVFVGIGSNDTNSDPDRLESLSRIVGKDKIRICICNGYCDNVDSRCFSSMKKWLRLTFIDADMPVTPTVSVQLNSDGVLYADVRADACSPIASATVFYAYNDIYHETRNWTKALCETVGKGEYLSRLTIPGENAKLFLYADITYENGVRLTSFILYSDFAGMRIPNTGNKTSESVIFSYGSLKSDFKDSNDDLVLFHENIETCTIPIGLNGSINRTGQMILFIGDITKNVDNHRSMQVDCYSEEKSFELVICLTDGNGRKFYAKKTMYTDVTFEAALFNSYDFKDENYLPLTSWKDTKRLTVCSKNVVVSKLLFV